MKDAKSSNLSVGLTHDKPLVNWRFAVSKGTKAFIMLLIINACIHTKCIYIYIYTYIHLKLYRGNG